MKLFVYGTLKRGQYNHARFGFNEVARLVGAATTRSITLLHSPDPRQDAFPYAYKHRPAGGLVTHGQLFHIDTNKANGLTLFANLYGMEVGAGYRLQEIKVKLESGALKKCFVFVCDKREAQYLINTYGFVRTTNWSSPNGG